MRLEGIKEVETDSDGTNSRLVISYLSGAQVSIAITDKMEAILIRMSLCQQLRGRYIVKNAHGRYVARDQNGYHTTGRLETALRLASPAAADILIEQVVAEWPLLKDQLRWHVVRRRSGIFAR